MKKIIALLLSVLLISAAPLALADRIDLSGYTISQLYSLKNKIEQEIQSRIAENGNHLGGRTGYFDLGDVAVALDGYQLQTAAGKTYMILSVKWLNQSDEATAYYVEAAVDAYQNGVELDNGYLSGVDTNTTRKVLPGYSTTIKEIFELENDKDPVVLFVRPWVDFRNEYPPQQVVIDIK